MKSGFGGTDRVYPTQLSSIRYIYTQTQNECVYVLKRVFVLAFIYQFDKIEIYSVL